MQQEAFLENHISLARIGKAMLDSGAITDYDNLQLDGSSKNVTLTEEELPRVKELTVTTNG